MFNIDKLIDESKLPNKLDITFRSAGNCETLINNKVMLEDQIEEIAETVNKIIDYLRKQLESECTDDHIYYDGEAYTIEKILNWIEKCDSVHDNCDCLLDHDECYYLINYIKQLKAKLEHWNQVADDIERYIEEEVDGYSTVQGTEIFVLKAIGKR